MASSHFTHLKKKWLRKHQVLQKKLLTAHKDVLRNLDSRQHLIATLMLASTPFLSISPAMAEAALSTYQTTNTNNQTTPPLTRESLSALLSSKLPPVVRVLTPNEENDIAASLSANLHMKITAELQGIRLNRSYGIIGKEQHLRRFPGDSIYDHIDSESNVPVSDGVAPGLGAWGYFASSKEQMTIEDSLREKYYIAVPTFLSPGWNEHIGEYGIFFKYRKMIVINPDNGKAIVADIADAGPAPFTGKNLGGSPEVMQYLERVDGAGRGPVLYFFIDDPHDTIPLGPVL